MSKLISSKKNVILGSNKSHVAICTLWSQKDIVAKDIDKTEYQIMGNLYSNKGINYIIRNTLANPSIRYIVLFGKDLSRSGDDFQRIMKTDVNLNSDKFNFLDIEKKYIDIFKKRIEFIDLRKKSRKEIIEKIKELNKIKLKIKDKPIILKEIIEKVNSLPSEESSFQIREKQISSAFIKVNDIILKFGEIKETQYDTKEKELVNTIITITDNKQNINSSLNLSKKKLKDYLPTIMSKEKPDEIVYTYGSRLFSYDVEEYDQVNQIENIVNILKSTKHSRRAVAVTWNVKKDYQSNHPPCLVYQHYLVRKNKLYLTTVFRSNDMFKAFPLNALALNELLDYVCKKTSLEYGSLTIISNSAHIYEPDWNEAKKRIEDYQKENNKRKEFIKDPRGYFIINLDKEEIEVNHYTNEDKQSGYIFKSNSAKILYNKIIKENLISRLDHAAYLGEELAKAETAIQNKKNYIQDQ